MPKYLAIMASVLKLKSVPRRLTVREMPKDRASSLPLNHLDMKAIWATTSDSDPAPKTSRPANSIGPDLARATISAPRTTSTENSRLARRVPSLSVRTPPKKTMSDGGQGVGRVQAADHPGAEMEGLDQDVLDGPDAVVGEVAAEGQQGDEQQQGEAVRGLWRDGRDRRTAAGVSLMRFPCRRPRPGGGLAAARYFFVPVDRRGHPHLLDGDRADELALVELELELADPLGSVRRSGDLGRELERHAVPLEIGQGDVREHPALFAEAAGQLAVDQLELQGQEIGFAAGVDFEQPVAQQRSRVGLASGPEGRRPGRPRGRRENGRVLANVDMATS